MRISVAGNLIVESAAPGVRVLRFARPDLWQYLDDFAEAAKSPLFREVQDAVLADLAKDGTLILNLSLVEAVTTTFYRCLLLIRKFVLSRKAHLVLCGLSPEIREVFDIFRAERLFQIVRTETEARRLANTRKRAQRYLLSEPEA